MIVTAKADQDKQNKILKKYDQVLKFFCKFHAKLKMCPKLAVLRYGQNTRLQIQIQIQNTDLEGLIEYRYRRIWIRNTGFIEFLIDLTSYTHLIITSIIFSFNLKLWRYTMLNTQAMPAGRFWGVGTSTFSSETS